MSEFGQRLRDLRKQQGISQRDLASQVGINWTYVCKIETGQIAPPSEDVIRRIAQVLDADANDLINASGKVPDGLKDVLEDNPLAVELVRVLSKRKLSEETYSQLLHIARESRLSA